MSSIDLNLIRTFVALYKVGSVAFAVEYLFTTQPLMSYALARLRELFDDALPARTRDDIQPTFVAEQFYGAFREPLTRIEGTAQSVRHFDSATVERRFHIVLTGLGEVGFLSLILERLTRDVSLTEVKVLPLQVDEVGAWLSSAKVDMAICHQPVPGAHSQQVLHERYVCLLSGRHPRIGDSLSLEQYLAGRRVVVTRTSGYGITEDVLEVIQIQRHINLRVSRFSVLPKIIPGTELLTILPAQIAYHFVVEGGMCILKLPFTLSSSDVSLYWHENSERSVVLDRFRTIIAGAIIAAQR